jgi:integrase
MLYETAARAGEIPALNIQDLELDAHRARITSKGGATEYVYWASGTAHLLPRLIRGRDRGPIFLSERRPAPPVARDRQQRASSVRTCSASGMPSSVKAVSACA